MKTSSGGQTDRTRRKKGEKEDRKDNGNDQDGGKDDAGRVSEDEEGGERQASLKERDSETVSQATRESEEMEGDDA